MIVKVRSIVELQREIEKKVGPLIVDEPQGFTPFWGLEVIEDFRIPEGVYVILPRGAALNHPEAQIHSMAPEYAAAAHGLRMMCRMSL